MALNAARTTIADAGIATPTLTAYVDLILRTALPPEQVRATLAKIGKRP